MKVLLFGYKVWHEPKIRYGKIADGIRATEYYFLPLDGVSLFRGNFNMPIPMAKQVSQPAVAKAYQLGI